MRTTEEATELLCPLARTFGTDKADAHCREELGIPTKPTHGCCGLEF